MDRFPSRPRPAVRLEGSAAAGVADWTQVVIVGHSRITRVVVAKIVERCGLQPLSLEPDAALRAIASILPGVVIVDGGADNRDCADFLQSVAASRRLSGRAIPAVILLSNVVGTPQSLNLDPVVDEVVAKPLTPEHLQPVVDRLMDRARGPG